MESNSGDSLRPAGSSKSSFRSRQQQLNGDLLTGRNQHLLFMRRASRQPHLRRSPDTEELRGGVCITRLILHIPSTGRAFDFPGSAKCLKYYSAEKKLADISTFGYSGGAWLWNLLLSVIKPTSGTLKESFFSVCRWKKASCSFTRDHSRTRRSGRALQPISPLEPWRNLIKSLLVN